MKLTPQFTQQPMPQSNMQMNMNLDWAAENRRQEAYKRRKTIHKGKSKSKLFLLQGHRIDPEQPAKETTLEMPPNTFENNFDEWDLEVNAIGTNWLSPDPIPTYYFTPAFASY